MILPRDAVFSVTMLWSYAMRPSLRLFVRSSVTLLYRILKVFFSTSGSPSILGFHTEHYGEIPMVPP